MAREHADCLEADAVTDEDGAKVVPQGVEGSLLQSMPRLQCFDHRQHMLPAWRPSVRVGEDARVASFRRIASVRIARRSAVRGTTRS